MKLCTRILMRILFPGLAVVLISVPVSAALLIHTFLSGDEESPVAFLSYGISAYSLTIVCARLCKNYGLIRQTVGTKVHRNKLAHRYLTDIFFKLHVSLYLSLAINLLFAAMNLIYGMYYRSVWFGTLAVYYIMLAVMRFLLVRHANRNAFGEDLESELRQYRLCGVIFLLMNIALSGVTVLVIQQNEGFAYAGYLIYIIAMYAFYNIISAVTDVVKYRKYQSPVMSAAKAVKLAAALVSMFSLETAMLTTFDERNDPVFRQKMTGLTGSCACLIVLAIAVFMILQSTRQLNRLRKSSKDSAEKEETEEAI